MNSKLQDRSKRTFGLSKAALANRPVDAKAALHVFPTAPNYQTTLSRFSLRHLIEQEDNWPIRTALMHEVDDLIRVIHSVKRGCMNCLQSTVHRDSSLLLEVLDEMNAIEQILEELFTAARRLSFRFIDAKLFSQIIDSVQALQQSCMRSCCTAFYVQSEICERWYEQEYGKAPSIEGYSQLVAILRGLSERLKSLTLEDFKPLTSDGRSIREELVVRVLLGNGESSGNEIDFEHHRTLLRLLKQAEQLYPDVASLVACLMRNAAHNVTHLVPASHIEDALTAIDEMVLYDEKHNDKGAAEHYPPSLLAVLVDWDEYTIDSEQAYQALLKLMSPAIPLVS